MHNGEICIPKKNGIYKVKFLRRGFSEHNWLEDECLIEWCDGVWDMTNIKNKHGIQRFKITHWADND